MATGRLGAVVLMCLGFHLSTGEVLRRQKRTWIIDSFTIDEGYVGQYPYDLGYIKVEKEFSLFRIQGEGVDKDPKGILEIDENTGLIRVLGPVDHESHEEFTVTFQALDRENKVVDTQLGIKIDILDANDNPPRFDPLMYTISVMESTLQGTELVTVKATDIDSSLENKKFDIRLVSVTPEAKDLEFYLSRSSSETSTISFRGCLDHETAEKYTLILEAKDYGKPQMSSSCTVIINIEDGNNHLPDIKGVAGPGKVKEGVKDVLVSRIQAVDMDSRGTSAWKAIYTIHNDTQKNFRIITNEETNEGMLYVDKSLDYEENEELAVTVSVQNNVPYMFCQVVQRSTTGAWKVVTKTVSDQKVQSTRVVKVTVEDVNESPVFVKAIEAVSLRENIAPGYLICTFFARDPDVKSISTITYLKGDDPAGWFTVDSVTGKLITAKIIDRESHFVSHGIYRLVVYAIDNGEPHMTGTTTLTINLIDENDNTPELKVNIIDICQSEGPSMANISAFDLDETPFGGPFQFRLIGDVEGMWRISPEQGFTVNVVKEKGVYSGEHQLTLEVSDLQGATATHNLTVVVCNCLNHQAPDCHSSKVFSSKVGPASLGIIFFALLLLAGGLLLLLLVLCEKESFSLPPDSAGNLMQSNTEMKGIDCEVAFHHMVHEDLKDGQDIKKVVKSPKTTNEESWELAVGNHHGNHFTHRSGRKTYRSFREESSSNKIINANFSRTEVRRKSTSHIHADSSSSQTHGLMDGRFKSWTLDGSYFSNLMAHRKKILISINKMLMRLEAPEEELGDYEPHVYAEEGREETNYELDAISIPETHFDLDLNMKFLTLARICTPAKSTLAAVESGRVWEGRHAGTTEQVEKKEIIHLPETGLVGQGVTVRRVLTGKEASWHRASQNDRMYQAYREDSHGQAYREDSYGQAYREDSHGQVYQKDSHGQAYREDSHGQAYREDSHGQVYQKDSHGQAYQKDSHGQAYQVDSYGQAYQEDSYRRAYREDSYGQTYREDSLHQACQTQHGDSNVAFRTETLLNSSEDRAAAHVVTKKVYMLHP